MEKAIYKSQKYNRKNCFSLDDIQIKNHYTLVGISCFADVSPLNLLVKGQEEDIISISRIHDDRKSFI